MSTASAFVNATLGDLQIGYKTKQQDRFNLYLAEYGRYIQQRLLKLCPNTWQEFQHVYIDFVRMLVDRRAGTLYNNPPSRSYTVDGEPVHEDTLLKIQALYKSSDINSRLDKAARYCQLHRTVAVMCVWRDNAVQLDVLPPMQWTAVASASDSTSLDAAQSFTVHINPPTQQYVQKDKARHTIWTWHTYSPGNKSGVPQWYHTEGTNIKDQGDNAYWYPEEMYGQIIKTYIVPVELLQYSDPDTGLNTPGGQDVVDTAIHIAYTLTDIGRTLDIQSHGQPLFTGMDPKEAATQLMGPTRALALADPDSDFRFVSADSAPVEARIKALNSLIAKVSHTYDLPADTFDETRAPESGTARRTANAPLNKARDGIAARMASFEAKLFKKMIVVHNAHVAPVDRIPFGVQVTVGFEQHTTPLDPTEQDIHDKARIEMGVLTPVDIIQRDLGLDREQAEQRYSDNLEINSKSGVSGLRAVISRTLAE